MSDFIKLNDLSYTHVRGFNYQPSYASHGIQIWQDKFDLARIDREMGLGRKHFPKINTLRLWMSHDAWMVDPDRYAEHYEAVVVLADKHDLKFIITLFNGWHSVPVFGGFTPEQIGWAGVNGWEQVYASFVRDLVAGHADDPRVLLWDLSNEPMNNTGNEDQKRRVFEFLERVYSLIKELGARSPICVGSTPDMNTLRALDPISDVLTTHPYWAKNSWVSEKRRFTEFVDEAVAFANSVGKPLLATETCWGSWDDRERSEMFQFELSELTKRGIGFTAHLMHETLVADGHRPHLAMTVPEGAGYMAFINMDGEIRPYHEKFNAFC